MCACVPCANIRRLYILPMCALAHILYVCLLGTLLGHFRDTLGTLYWCVYSLKYVVGTYVHIRIDIILLLSMVTIFVTLNTKKGF